MRVLIAHSFYRQPGGEDRYVRQQVELLRAGHEVRLEGRVNAQLSVGAATAAGMLRSRAERAHLTRVMDAFRPDVVHLHNPYPSLGPEVHLAARAAALPLVQTAHNFRLRCPNGLMFTEGAPCQRCVGGRYDNAVRHGCFPTISQRIAYASTLWLHRFALGLDAMVDMYVAPSQFVRRRLIEWGIPADRTVVVRNFTDIPSAAPPPGEGGLYLGRLSPEKGVDTLLQALARIGDPPFEIAGSGGVQAALEAEASRLGLRRVRFLGQLDRAGVDAAIRRAGYLAVPSRWDENAPLAAIEGLAAGRPLIATATGGLPELAGDGRGLLVPPGDADGLGAAIDRMIADASLRLDAGERAAAFARAELTPETHLAGLEAAYAAAVASRNQREESPPPPLHALREPRRVHGPTDAGVPAVRQGARRSLHVLMVHCYYRDLGGENLSFEAEVGLLEAGGVRVTTYTRDNRELTGAGPVRQAQVGLRTTWADDTYGALRDLIRRERPDVVHFQNTFPLISPAAIHAAHRLGRPVVMALRNYRLLCASGVLFRDGAICHDCVGRSIPLPAIQHRCYHESVSRTGAVVAMQVAHRVLGTWQDAVDTYVTPSEFARQLFASTGIPADRIVVKPNFVDADPGVAATPGSYALFAGRLAPEKGVLTLVDAWRDPTLPPLRIIGDGPLRDELAARIAMLDLEDRVELMGRQSPEQVLELMHDARVVVFPSEWYETFGRVAAEAFACGVPVVASRLGAMAEIVDDGVTGRLFAPGDPGDLASAVLDATGTRHAAMRDAARAEYEARYTAAQNLDQLLAIYEKVRRSSPTPAGGA